MHSSPDNYTIDWPPWWKGKGGHFLEGFPFFGTQCKIIRHVRTCLESRNQKLFDSVWIKSGRPLEECRFIAANIGLIVQAYVAWPNYCFFPEDRTSLLLGVIPGVWFDAEDPVEDVRSFFHIRGVRDGDFTYYSAVLEGRFVDLVDIIIKIPE